MNATRLSLTMTVARFWQKVSVGRPKDCWLWTAGTGSHGYGTFYPQAGVQKLAHRYALELAMGDAPAGAEALHSCDNKRCVNPAHLRWGSHAENMAEAADRGLTFAPNKGRSHCPHGHAMDEENTIHKTKDGYARRSCRECNRLYLERRRARNGGDVGAGKGRPGKPWTEARRAAHERRNS